MMDMLGKLNEMQKKMEDIKKRLDTIEVNGEAGDGKVKVTANANKKVLDIAVDDALMNKEEKEQLVDLLTVAVNRAMENADNVAESETQAITSDLMPNLPGMFK